jgi:hypothetical protein
VSRETLIYKKMKKTTLFFGVIITMATLCLIGCEGQSSLAAPSGFNAEQEDNTIVLTWNEVINASYYEISKCGTYWQSTSETHIVDRNPVEGINYYEIIAYDGDKQSKQASTSCYFEWIYDNSGDEPTGDNPNDETATTFYIAHLWGGVEWSWRQMTKSGNSYTCTGVWGGIGASINTIASDRGAIGY